jgi:DNA-binding NarL/FixJ family response regulator
MQACATELAVQEVEAAAGSPAALLGLSRAELAVARLVATGLTNREVASQLYVSVKTVEYPPQQLHQARHHLPPSAGRSSALTQSALTQNSN